MFALFICFYFSANIYFYTNSISDDNIQCKHKKVKKINKNFIEKQQYILYNTLNFNILSILRESIVQRVVYVFLWRKPNKRRGLVC